MERRAVGSSGLLTSVLGLGTNNFGFRPGIDPDRIVGQAIDSGILFFDTADVYGDGISETQLGKALQGRRHEVHVATKFGVPMGLPPGMHEGPTPVRRGSRDFVLKALDASLRRLGTDYIDLYQMHFPDPDTPVEETMGLLVDLIRSGKVRYVGLSNAAPWQLVEYNMAGRALGASFVSMQSEYSLLRREIVEPDLSTVAQRHGASVLCYFPLAGGLLSGRHQSSGVFAPGSRMADVKVFAERFGSPENLARVEALTNFARERGYSLLDLALSWPLANPAVSTVIAGATSAEQVIANAKAIARWELSAEERNAIDAIVGRPTAPPTY